MAFDFSTEAQALLARNELYRTYPNGPPHIAAAGKVFHSFEVRPYPNGGRHTWGVVVRWKYAPDPERPDLVDTVFGGAFIFWRHGAVAEWNYS